MTTRQSQVLTTIYGHKKAEQDEKFIFHTRPTVSLKTTNYLLELSVQQREQSFYRALTYPALR